MPNLYSVVYIGIHGILHDLTLDRVACVNLFVGRNGVGKSALLDAIRCMSHGAPDIVTSKSYNIAPQKTEINEDMKMDIVELLKLVDSRIVDIQFDACSRIKLSFTDDTNSIKKGYKPEYFGNGMCYMVTLASKLMEARNNVLLIDEFGVGLHYSVIRKLWDMLFMLANKYSIQIFATTHSQDVIAGFSASWKKHEKDGSFCRLSKCTKSTREGTRPVDVVNYDCEILEYAVIGRIEVR